MEKYTISTGRSRTDLEWKTRQVTWDQIRERLQQCRKTPEKYREYKLMSRTDKARIKDVGGFVGGDLGGGQRKASNVRSRSLLTLDIDYGRNDTVGTVEDMLSGTSWILYSTHSHSTEAPRYRLVIPLSREVTPDEYIPIARRVAESVGIDTFDDSTYQPERLMYWPSASQDSDFVYKEQLGKPADVDYYLNTYTDWRDVSEWPVSKRVQRLSQGHAKQQEDPTLKPGIIGAFCRTYSITGAVEAFLSEVYRPAGKDRLTYVNGSTEAGAVIYEDKWLYSHHGTDPCCEKEVNAFDMVRIHLFGHLDAEADIDTPVNRLPSFTQMDAFARADRKVNGTIVREKLASLDNEFAGIQESDNDDSWKELLKIGKTGVLATPANYALILRNDPGLRDVVRRDMFRDRSILLRDLPWRKMEDGPYWENIDDVNLVSYVSKMYGATAVTKTVLLDEWDAIISQTAFHPVRDYLKGLVWDGTERLDTMLADYLGASDNELTRAMTRKHFVAAVARIMRPGVKYDYVLTLVGDEGIGKSTIIRALGGEWFDDSFSSGNIGDKEAMEQLRGRWLIEMGELKDYKKSTVESFKAFISKQDDSYRPAYGRKTEHYRRQCVFFATTNERAFLKGDTGNRRFWTIEVGVECPIYDVFALDRETVGQIWAEAVVRYKAGEELFLPAYLEKQARVRQAEHNEIAIDDRIGIIAACIRRKLPASWWDLNRKQRRDFYKEAADLADDEPFVRRDTICAIEVQEEFFGLVYDRYKSRDINQIFTILGFEYLGQVRTNDKEYGQQRRYKIPDTFYDVK